MGKGRLEAFRDGVIAVIITIMVLEMKVPHGDELATLQPVVPVLILRHDGEKSTIARALGNDFKGRISVVIYLAAIPLAYFNRWLSLGLYIAVAIMWLIPDRRIERVLDH